MHICIALLLSAMVMGSLPSLAQAFDFEDMEIIEKAEQEDLLAKAGQAARDWNFSEARSLLKQAQQKGYAPTEVESVEKLIADNESAKAEQERRAEEERQAKIAAQEAAQRRSAVASSSGEGGGSSDNIRIEVSCQSPMCSVKDLQISSEGGPQIIDASADNATIFKGYDGRLDGEYDYSVRLEPYIDSHVVCSGSFALTGSESVVYLHFHTDCSDAGSSVQVSQ